MSRRVVINTGAALVAIISLTLSGCSSNAENSIRSTDGIGESSSNQTELPPIESPLDEYLSLVLGLGHSPAEQRQIAEQRTIMEEDFIAQCMYNDGFTYIPFIERTSQLNPEDQPRPNDSDWVAQWGYGVFTNPPGSSPQFLSRGEFAENDPNFEVFNNLSSGEQAAWLEALWGRPDNPSSGCQAEGWQLAQEETPASLFQTDEFLPLFNAWADITWNANYEFIDADSDWANCMANGGFTGLERQLDAELKVHSLVMADQTELERSEIEIALADLQCREEVDYAARRREHIVEAEARFVNDHRSSLEALRDAAEQRGVTWLND